MATGNGLTALIPAAMTLVGIITMLRARARRRNRTASPDSAEEDRRAATLETERRMASYLASRDQRAWHDDDA
jgi:cytochrome c-type biogenesis protein CcmH/NrfF